MEPIYSQDMNLDPAALEQFAIHLAANAEKATCFAPFTGHNANNNNAA
jgi:hypothetical protein